MNCLILSVLVSETDLHSPVGLRTPRDLIKVFSQEMRCTVNQIAPRLAFLVNSGRFGEPVIELEKGHAGMLLIQVSAEKWCSNETAREENATIVGQHFPGHQILVLAHRQDEGFDKAVVDFCERLKKHRKNLHDVHVVTIHELHEGPLNKWLHSGDHMHTFGLLKNVLNQCS